MGDCPASIAKTAAAMIDGLMARTLGTTTTTTSTSGTGGREGAG
ncbi:hypothetical protein [Hyphobacterium sp.]